MVNLEEIKKQDLFDRIRSFILKAENEAAFSSGLPKRIMEHYSNGRLDYDQCVTLESLFLIKIREFRS